MITNTATIATPVGWVTGSVGGAAVSQLAINHNEQILNNHDSTFDDKVASLKIIEWATDYRSGLAFGAIGRGAGFLLKGGGTAANAVASTSKETAIIGRKAAKEIAKNGGKFTPLARQLILEGKKKATEEVAKKVAKEVAKELAANAASSELLSVLAKEAYERINRDEDSLSSAIILIETMEGALSEMRRTGNLNLEVLRRGFLKQLLKINRENVSYYIKWGVNYDQHREIDRTVNRVLREARNQ